MSRRNSKARAAARRAAADGKTPGEAQYERELIRRPLYQTGKPRPAWSELTESVRRAWEQIAD